MLLPFGTAAMFRVAGKVPGGVMTERWHLGTWLGKRFHTEEHIVARKGDGLVIRSRAVKAMPEETTLDDLDSIRAPSGVSRDVLPDFPRPTLRRVEPPFAPVEERPVPRSLNISQDILEKFGYTPGGANATNIPIQAWHILRIVGPGSRQQAGRTLCIVTVLSVFRTTKDGFLCKGSGTN